MLFFFYSIINVLFSFERLITDGYTLDFARGRDDALARVPFVVYIRFAAASEIMKLIWKLKKTELKRRVGEGQIIRPDHQNYGELQCRARKTRLLSEYSSAAGSRRLLHEKHKIRAYRSPLHHSLYF